jgi:hypothetical protein
MSQWLPRIARLELRFYAFFGGACLKLEVSNVFCYASCACARYTSFLGGKIARTLATGCGFSVLMDYPTPAGQPSGSPKKLRLEHNTNLIWLELRILEHQKKSAPFTVRPFSHSLNLNPLRVVVGSLSTLHAHLERHPRARALSSVRLQFGCL